MSPHTGIYQKTEEFIEASGLDLLFSLLDSDMTIRIFSLSLLEWGNSTFMGAMWSNSNLLDTFDLGHPCSRLFKQEAYSFYYRGQSAPTIDWNNFHEVKDAYFNLGKYHLIMPISEWHMFLNHRGEEVAYKTSREIDKYKMMESLSE